MNRKARVFIGAVAALAATSALAEVTFFDAPNFGGRQIVITGPTSDFGPMDFRARAQSAIIVGGPWEVCADFSYGGNCTILGPGRYPLLDAWAGRISSARPGVPPPVASVQPPAFAPPASGALTFYELENFGGRQFAINQPIGNFYGLRANEHSQSVVVDGTAWEICTDADFRGECRTFAPGRYPTLGVLEGRVNSARPYYETRAEPVYDRSRGRASATLYSGPNLTGRSIALGGPGTSNLDGMFNDRASSLRVDRGYWLFCSDANFQGECRTFGPGEYPYLPPDLDNRISSGRRISNEYPYTNSPTWR